MNNQERIKFIEALENDFGFREDVRRILGIDDLEDRIKESEKELESEN